MFKYILRKTLNNIIILLNGKIVLSPLIHFLIIP